MNIDRGKAEAAFRDYVSHYNAEEEKVRLKIEHTFRVAGLCEQIARSLELEKEEQDLAWFTGLLHDAGRFEQLKNYGTFIDADSIDHAEYGAQILFEQGKIRDYTEDASEDTLLWNAVRYHSAYRIPVWPDERTERFCHILRDADKIDILKVNVDFPPEEIYNVSSQELRSCPVSEAVMEAFYEEHAILRSLKRTAADHLVGHISLVFELQFPESRQIVKRQGYLLKLMDFESQNPVTREQFRKIRAYMTEYMERGSR